MMYNRAGFVYTLVSSYMPLTQKVTTVHKTCNLIGLQISATGNQKSKRCRLRSRKLSGVKKLPGFSRIRRFEPHFLVSNILLNLFVSLARLNLNQRLHNYYTTNIRHYNNCDVQLSWYAS